MREVSDIKKPKFTIKLQIMERGGDRTLREILEIKVWEQFYNFLDISLDKNAEGIIQVLQKVHLKI